MLVSRLLMIGVIALALPAIASAQTFTNYDKFTGPLSPALWGGFEANTSFAVISNTESRRAVLQPDPLVANRFLQLALVTGHPGTVINTGGAGVGQQILRMMRDDIVSGDVAVTGLKTTMVMVSAAAGACPSGDTSTLARARMMASFFNDGSSAGAGDATGDILAELSVELQTSTSGAVTRTITALRTRCEDAQCNNAETVSQTFTRRWKIGVGVPLTIVWDRANSQFVYTAGAGTTAEVRTISYAPSTVVGPSVLNLRDLRVANTLPACSTAVKASTTARFDFLKVSTEAGVFP